VAASDLTSFRTVEAFLSPCSPSGKSPLVASTHIRRIDTQRQSSAESNGSETGNEEEQHPDPVEAFMEDASQKGADKVRDMSIEERTRRAMLAEAMEDRIFTMYDDLEGLLEDGLPKSTEERDEIQSIAKEIKASQSQYEDMVSGQPSEMLGTINNIGTNSSDTSSNRRKDQEKDDEE
jgi:hypothetical protein